ncbi:Rho GTPase activation protein [Lentinula raphanica]|nr:Rho GTPase activation protein [Lentinula raphanica]
MPPHVPSQPHNMTLKQRLAALSAAPSAPSAPHHPSHRTTYPDHDNHNIIPTTLSISTSTSRPDFALETPTKSPRRRAFNLNALTPSWTKKSFGMSSNIEETRLARGQVEHTIAKLIFQAGVDYETRPMVVLNASALPDPREVDYDVLLSRILSYLDLYVESDYTAVFFAAGGPHSHSPAWNWVWKAYRSLSRKYRKNFKRLYIVHSSFFTKMLFSLAGAIISPKFFRKITYINTLSELACYVPLTQIDVPPAVYQENAKHEKQIALPNTLNTLSNTFGVPLEDIMGYEGDKGGIPRVVKDSIQYLRESGLEEEGLFRRSPSSAMLRAVQEAYDRGNVVSLETFGDRHLAAVLLKKFLKDLPTPVFPETMYGVVRRCPAPTGDPGDMASVMYVRDVLLPELAPCTYILLNHVLHLMHEVSLRSDVNRMDAHNLAVVLCPNLVRGSSPIRDVQMCVVPGGPQLFSTPSTSSPSSPSIPPSSSSSSSTSNPAKPSLAEGKTTLGAVIKLCIERYYEIFDEVVDPGEVTGMNNGAVLGHDEDEYSHHDELGLEYDGHTPEQSRSWSMSRSREFSGEQLNDDLEFVHPSNSRTGNHKRNSSGFRTNPDDDEEIDDAMLVMPIGPTGSNHRQEATVTNHNLNGELSASISSLPSSSSSSSSASLGSPLARPGLPRHRNSATNSPPSRLSRPTRSPRSIHTDSNSSVAHVPPPSSFSTPSLYQSTQSAPYATYSRGKARSTISVEKGSVSTVGPNGKKTSSKGSISISRGTNRTHRTQKSTGSGVAAIGITAEGFFTPPAGVPPVPPVQDVGGRGNGNRTGMALS